MTGTSGHLRIAVGGPLCSGLVLAWEETVLRLNAALDAMRREGASVVYLKDMAPNDNSKNQYYLGRDESALRCLGVTLEDAEVSGEGKRTALRAPQPLRWISPDGTHPAPGAKIIFYPQYPEVRLSGIVRGVPRTVPGRDLARDRLDERVMLLGVTDHDLLVWVGEPDRSERFALETRPTGDNPLLEVVTATRRPSLTEAWADLLDELRIIITGPPVQAQRLARDGLKEYTAAAPNAPGYTLEALFGIEANSDPAPDYRGLIELKVVSQKVTLMTPEPTSGLYVDAGKLTFLQRWGHESRGKLRFTGLHRVDVAKSGQPLGLSIEGWSDADPRTYDPRGRLVLASRAGEVGAAWLLSDLHSHWLKKHPEVAFVPYSRDKPANTISFEIPVHAGHGTDFAMFMRALASGHVYLDPGTSMPLDTEKVHARNQFRVNRTQLDKLYGRFERHDLGLT